MTPSVFELLSGLERGPMAGLMSVFAFVLGSLVGSFLNVVIYRVPLGRSIVLPPSACTTCNTPLKWYYNLPVLSYFSLGGKCRYCGSSYSIRYAALEFFCGCFFYFSQQQFGLFSLAFFKTVVLFSLCLSVFFIDLDHWIIPDGINLLGVLFGLAFSLAAPLSSMVWLETSLGVVGASFVWSLVGALVGVGFFWSIQVVGLILVKQEAMGGGDVKFAALIGAFLGPVAAFWSFLGSFFLGALFAVPLLLLRRGGGKDPIPFGTFMAVSAVFFQIVDYSVVMGYLDGFYSLVLPMDY